MQDPPLIAMEIHDLSLWEPSRVLPAIDAMERWGYNALVLHQNDLLDACTQIGMAANYGVADLRLKKVRNNTAWLNRLIRRLAEFDARLFLEIKEPSFHDYALEFFPNLIGPDGHPDPTHPDWAKLCRQKTEALLAEVPRIGGLIINLSSPESRVSLPDYLATHGSEQSISGWFDTMIGAFHAPLKASGKQLFIRDFSYTETMQSDVLAAVDRCDGTVGASVKITAHDYFPEFPENPAARHVASPVILEFEAFGEHMGWGGIPNCRVDEFRRRMFGYRDIGAVGFLMRISWEAISGESALDSLSAVNVFALPRLIDKDTDANGLVMDWLAQEFGVTGEIATRAADLMRRSWAIPAAAYWNGMVFPRHSCLPSTWQEGWLSMQSNGMGRRDRDLGISPNDPLLSEESRITLFEIKEKSTVLARELAREAAILAQDLPPPVAELFSSFRWLPVFARQFELATKATYHAARAQPSDLAALPALRDASLRLAETMVAELNTRPGLPHHVRVLLVIQNS